MSVRLRAHHLLCVLTFAGDGYTPDFVANLAAIAGRIGAGEPIELIDGADDICEPLAGTGDEHCANASTARRDRAALLALAEAGVPVGVRPLVYDAATLAHVRAAFAAGTIRGACRGCEWSALCTAIAENGFAGTALATPAPER